MFKILKYLNLNIKVSPNLLRNLGLNILYNYFQYLCDIYYTLQTGLSVTM